MPDGPSTAPLTLAAQPALQSGPPSFGVVVLNWNNAQETMRCVEALEAIDPAPDHVVVVDNGSEDDSVERLESWADEHWIWRMSGGTSDSSSRAEAPWLVIARAGSNRGFAGGNNVGIRYLQQRTTVSHILLLNNDATLAPTFFAEIAKAIATYPDSGLLTGTIYEDPDRTRVWYAGGVEYPLRALMQHRYDVPESSEPAPTEFISGCAMVISRHLVERIGPLAECYFPAYWEDGEYSYRAREAGLPVLYVPAATVYHKVGSTVRAADMSLTLDRCKNRLRVFYVRRNYHGLRKGAALGYLAVTKPGRAILETLKGHPRSGWAILSGTIAGFVSPDAKR
ncbi:MAG TPA: glycosyltransferase family 2 protein [Gemmatimonadaceae bacterium]